ncbi:hypothetical protein DH2020_020940 [Rehmannia glutinosa]|uniref:Uncharacterized protein n=1 Tax=Rehmannia glutinosa TaxID=99300 RepID=A0ABR0WDC0_REHGL
MASSHFLCSHHLYSSSNGKTQFSSFKKGSFCPPSSFKPHGSSSLGKKSRFSRTHWVRATASDSKTGRKQVEVAYNLEDKFNKLADEVDKDVGMSRLTLFSPCKINVFLRITGKRADGYHDLASLFHVISLGDKIKFSLSPSKSTDRLSTNVPGVPLDERNLIHLDKKVPTGAGLGGGSSNAATALWAANQFSGCVATEKELKSGLVVEDITPPIPFDLPMVLIKPQEACSTAEVYKCLRVDKTSKIDPLSLLEKISSNGISQDVCVNDLEPPAFEVLPSLKRLKQRIIAAGRGQYDAVFMSGSGSTIVGVGSPDPPQFVYDDDEYKDVFLSEANFITRPTNQWYAEPLSTDACTSPTGSSRSIE